MKFRTTGLSKVRIGTSGIVVPGTIQDFPPEFKSDSRLHYYSSLFSTIEINSSFHKIPRAATFAKWAAEVPEDFQFTVKLWRGITHAKKLLYSKEDIRIFLEAANHLANKKGCLLLQFPASITFEYLDRLEEILAYLKELDTEGFWKLALELRHKSWYNEITYERFARYNASLVFHDIAASKTPFNQPLTSVIYIRFHGPTGNYRGTYSDDLLEGYAERIKKWVLKKKEVYVYFNNTMGSAFDNAQLLQRLLAHEKMNKIN